ncbi:MAG: diadenylate cyclase CdaA [Clostridia bacterium]|nr:diadenylate cyclase CdaA [Clostridia bacterium]
MENFQNAVSSFFQNLTGVLSGFDSITDLLDVLLVAVIIYALIVQLRKTQSVHMIRGIMLMGVLYVVVVMLRMQTSKFLFNYLIRDLFLLIVIIFSNEIRHALEHMGHSRFKRIFFPGGNDTEVADTVNATVRACASMSEDKIGSLIVFRRMSNLGELERSGVYIDAKVTTEMLCSIFFPKAALHDGAIVIDGDRITAARCIVSMKNDIVVTEKVGTRHRAAIALSQSTDAVVVVTSEETGIISIAVDGVLRRGITAAELRELLSGYLLNDSAEGDGFSSRIKKLFKIGGKKNGGKSNNSRKENNEKWDSIQEKNDEK